MKVQKRARSVGFDWDNAEDVVAVLRGEIEELEGAQGDAESIADELGDVLFTAVNLARHLDVDPEIALSRANDTFAARFRVVERLAGESGQRLRDLDLAKLDQLWETAKIELSTTETESSFTLKPERNNP